MTKRLSPLDSVFVHLESKNCPQHAAALFVFELPKKAPPDYLRNLFLRMRSYPVSASPFNYRLAPGLLNRILPSWETLSPESIDIDYHLRLSALPAPGGELELGILVSRLYSHPVDMERPLWEIHLIDGLEGGRFAFFMKMHHALTDGMAGMKMIQSWLTDEISKIEQAPIWSKPRIKTPGKATSFLRSGKKQSTMFLNGLGNVVEALPEVFGGVQRSFQSVMGKDMSGLMVPYTAPRSILNQAITQRRRISTQSLPLKRLNQLSQILDMTLNDVVLAIIGSAVRRYLKEIDALPTDTLVAGVLASLRPKNSDTTSGNAIGFVFADLATDCQDPLKRAQRVKRSTHEGKTQLRNMSGLGMSAYSGLAMAPYVLSQAFGQGHLIPPMHSLAVSNLPGPTKQMYFDGARLQAMYPLTIIAHGQALLIAMISSVDQLAFSIVACPDAVPHSQRIAVYLEDALVELEQQAKPQAGQ